MGLPAPWTLPANPPGASPFGPALDGWAPWSASRPPATRTAASSADIRTIVIRNMRLPPLQRNSHPPREDEKACQMPLPAPIGPARVAEELTGHRGVAE